MGCEQCSTLYYVQCDWCIKSHTCFNSSRNQDCDGGSKDNGKYIVWKDGWCHGVCRICAVCLSECTFCCRIELPDPSIWEQIKDYYLEIPILFRFILLTLSSICLVLFCICT